MSVAMRRSTPTTHTKLSPDIRHQIKKKTGVIIIKVKLTGAVLVSMSMPDTGNNMIQDQTTSLVTASDIEHKEQVWALDMEARRADIESKKDSWDAGCGRCSGGLVRYLGQMVCCGAVLAFSFVQIGRNPSGENSVYFSLMSGILGYVLPSPQIGN